MKKRGILKTLSSHNNCTHLTHHIQFFSIMIIFVLILGQNFFIAARSSQPIWKDNIAADIDISSEDANDLISNHKPVRKYQHDNIDVGYYIITFSGPIRNAWKEQMIACGVELVGYLPEFAYLSKLDINARSEVLSLPFIVGMEPFSYELKYSEGAFGANPSALTHIDPNNDLIIQFDPDGAAVREKLMNDLIDLGGEIGSYSNDRLIVSINKAKLSTIARLENVLWLEPAPEFRYFNNVTSGIIDTVSIWNDLGMDGTGQVVTVCDTGLDNGSYSNLHEDFRGRLIKAYAFGDRGGAWSDDDIHFMGQPNRPVGGHGTHVAGSVLGGGNRSGGAIKGMAYNASLVFQSTMTSQGSMKIPIDMYEDLYNQPYSSDNSRIHTNSWGDPQSAGSYSSWSSVTDQFIWDYPDQIILFAAGNIRGNINVSSPGTAKNVITVGASESYRTTPTFPDHASDCDNIDQMASFSCYGTNDKRLKPDVLSPGTGILSTRSILIPDPDDHYWKNYDDFYAYAGGTSMATPITAGAVALIRQYFTDMEKLEPSAALVKAALINGAEDMPSSGGSQPIPNYQEGWGRINISKSINPEAPVKLFYIDNDTGLNTVEKFIYAIEVLDNSIPLNITLVWSDHPASPSATSTLVNDLHLNVTHIATGESFKGNVFLNGWSSSDDANANSDWDKYSTGYDNVNNVEGLRIKKPKLGWYKLTIIGSNVPFGPQPFSFALSGALNIDLLRPVNVTIEPVPTGKALNVFWDPILGPHVFGYEIYRSLLPNTNFILINTTIGANSDNYLDQDLVDGTKYYYKLKTKAINGSTSNFTDVVFGIPADISPPWVEFQNPTANMTINDNITIRYLSEDDCTKIIFKYFNDTNSNGYPDDVGSWQVIGTDTLLTGEFDWNTTTQGSGPGNKPAVILGAETFDEIPNVGLTIVKNLSVDNQPPNAPTMDTFSPNPTNQNSITLTGLTEYNATVHIYADNEIIGSNISDEDNIFNVAITLSEGLNNITARALDFLGNGPGPASAMQQIVLDTTPPVANAGGAQDHIIDEDSWATFNATLSYDTNPKPEFNKITYYGWSFELFNGTSVLLEGIVTKYYFDTMGKYPITLSVTDSAQNVGILQFELQVKDKTAPLVKAGKNFTWDEHKYLFLNSNLSTDNDPDFNATANFTWMFYDYHYTFLFNLTLDFKKFLNDGLVKEEIESAFADREIPVSIDAKIIIINNRTWRIIDDGLDTELREINKVLMVYDISDPNLRKTEEIILFGKNVSYCFSIPDTYNITLNVTDAAGNWALDWLTVTIGDVTTPFADPGSDKIIDQGRIATFNASGSWDNDPTFSTTGNFTWYFRYIDKDITLYGITTEFRFKKSNVFTVRLSVSDKWNNKATAEILVRVHADIKYPVVAWTYPIDNSWEVPVTSIIKIKINETLDIQRSPFELETFQLLDSKYTAQPGELRYDPTESVIFFIPTKILKFGESYSVFLRNTIMDLAGNRLDGNGDGILDSKEDNFKFVFSTTNMTLSPYDGMSNTPVDSNINIDFGGKISNLTLDSSKIVVIDTQTNEQLFGTSEIDHDNSTITFSFDDDLASDHGYQVTFTMKFYLVAPDRLNGSAEDRDISSNTVNFNETTSGKFNITGYKYSWTFSTRAPDKDRGYGADLGLILLFSFIIVIIVIVVGVLFFIIRRNRRRQMAELREGEREGEYGYGYDPYYDDGVYDDDMGRYGHGRHTKTRSGRKRRAYDDEHEDEFEADVVDVELEEDAIDWETEEEIDDEDEWVDYDDDHEDHDEEDEFYDDDDEEDEYDDEEDGDDDEFEDEKKNGEDDYDYSDLEDEWVS